MFAEQNSSEWRRTALLIAWPGYLWMGFLFIFTSILLFTDAILSCYQLVIRRLSRRVTGIYIHHDTACRIALLLAVAASVYAFIEAGQIRSEHVVIASPKLPSSVSRIRIVQISDVHIGLLLQEDRLQRILEKIREAGPDILVSTGDLVDGKLNRDYGISERDPTGGITGFSTGTFRQICRDWQS